MKLKPLPRRTFLRLIERGKRDAAALDKAIRSQFEMTSIDAAARLR